MLQQLLFLPGETESIAKNKIASLYFHSTLTTLLTENNFRFLLIPLN